MKSKDRKNLAIGKKKKHALTSPLPVKSNL
jgi:hypothetical protein